MALRSTCRSSRSTASRACRMAAWYAGTATAARIMMMAITTISSTSVKPALRLRFVGSPFKFPSSTWLPVGVFRSIEGRALRLGVHVKHALPAIRVGLWIVLHGAHSPLLFAGHRVHGDTPQELHLLVLDIDAVHESLQVWRIVLAVHLCL